MSHYFNIKPYWEKSQRVQSTETVSYGVYKPVEDAWYIQVSWECMVYASQLRMHGVCKPTENAWRIQVSWECMVYTSQLRMHGIYIKQVSWECMVYTSQLRMHGVYKPDEDTWCGPIQASWRCNQRSSAVTIIAGEENWQMQGENPQIEISLHKNW